MGLFKKLFGGGSSIEAIMRQYGFDYYFMSTFSYESEAKIFWDRITSRQDPPVPTAFLWGSWISLDYNNAQRWFVAWLTHGLSQSNAIDNWWHTFRPEDTPVCVGYGSPNSPLGVRMKIDKVYDVIQIPKKQIKQNIQPIVKTVKIGVQVWMAENLNVDHYRNGDPIPQVKDYGKWWPLTTGAWCYYGNNPENGKKYGKMYNGYTVNDLRGLAPVGWHIPTDDEWQNLIDYLGGDAIAGGKMKETGTTNWLSPNNGAINTSGFSALPGGYRCYHDFDNLGKKANFWSSTKAFSLPSLYYRHLHHAYPYVDHSYYGNQNGFSVRCVRDN